MDESEHGHHDTDPTTADKRRHGDADTERHALPNGLSVAANGLRLVPIETRIEPNVDQEWTYRIRDVEGEIVTAFEETHEQLAHLILVRRDLTHFQHLHPNPAEDGTWSVEFGLPAPGVYRAFVDVLVNGQPTTLGVDLLASGSARYGEVPRTTHRTTVDGYDVELTPQKMSAGESISIEFEVRRDGDVARLDPYLGALGHLVALRDGDLAYLHVHPEETNPAEGVVRFTIRFPTVGQYRLFLQAKPNGELITTSFDVHAED